MDVLPHEKPIVDYKKSIDQLKTQNRDNPLFNTEIERLEEKLGQLKQKVYTELTPWQRVQICRHPNRPHSIDYIKNIAENFIELAGDRTYSDDRAIIGGLGTIGGIKCMIIAQEKGMTQKAELNAILEC